MRLEAKVGLFVLLGIAALLALSTRVASVANIGRDGYALHALVPNALGLEVNAPVRIHGVEAGYLRKMRVEGDRVRLELFIYKEHKVADDSTMVIAQESVLGGATINLVSGGSKTYFADGAMIKNQRKRASLDEAVDEFHKFMESLNDTFDEETKGDLKAAIANLRLMGEKLAAAGEEFSIAGKTINKSLPKIMDQIDDLTAEFRQTGKDINKKLPEILDKFSAIEDDLKGLIEENRKPLNETISSVKTFFDKGGETLDALDNMLGKAEKAELQIDLFYNRFWRSHLNDSLGEGGVNVAYLPNPTSYYMLGVKSTPIIDRLDENGDPILPKIHEKEGEDYLISAQLGKRYRNFLVRGGIINSTGGIGADFFADNDRLKVSLDAYDFNAIHDIRGNNPHLRFTARYLPWRYIAIYGGYDNFVNRDAASFFAGAGVHFVDDDLKYLILSGAGGAAAAAK
ncbi:MAG: MlaD family protein [Helicobacteraceae bacterium]|jgi:phospholipid/cholesterol/gamma-HCH transport system substrate-binding protein|nr:MlaD family protein [Helicobacteraceae bacterium]